MSEVEQKPPVVVIEYGGPGDVVVRDLLVTAEPFDGTPVDPGIVKEIFGPGNLRKSKATGVFYISSAQLFLLQSRVGPLRIDDILECAQMAVKNTHELLAQALREGRPQPTSLRFKINNFIYVLHAPQLGLYASTDLASTPQRQETIPKSGREGR